MPNQLMKVSKTVVDMRISTWDEKTSQPDKGIFDWKERKYINFRATPRPEFWFTWCPYLERNGYADLRDWRLSGGWEPLKYPRDKYFCEGAEFTPEGTFRYGDLILVRRPLKREIEERLEEEKLNRGGQANIDKFTADMRAQGFDVPKEMIESMLRSF